MRCDDTGRVLFVPIVLWMANDAQLLIDRLVALIDFMVQDYIIFVLYSVYVHFMS